MNHLKKLLLFAGMGLLLILYINMGTQSSSSSNSNLPTEKIVEEYEEIAKKVLDGYYGKGAELVRIDLQTMGSYLSVREPSIKDCLDLEKEISSLLPGEYVFKNSNLVETRYCPTIPIVTSLTTSFF